MKNMKNMKNMKTERKRKLWYTVYRRYSSAHCATEYLFIVEFWFSA